MQRQTQNLHLLQGGSPPARWPAIFVFVSAYLILFWFYVDYFDFILIILIIFWFILHFVHGWHMCFDYFVDYLFDLFFGNSWNNQIWPDGCAGSLNPGRVLMHFVSFCMWSWPKHISNAFRFRQIYNLFLACRGVPTANQTYTFVECSECLMFLA